MIHMTFWTSLLLALSVGIAANPVLVDRSPVTLSLSRRFNFSSAYTLVQHDQARARALKLRGTAKSSGLSVLNNAIDELIQTQGVGYVAAVDVGSPPTTYQLLVDTGSSNTWVGANQTYTPTSTSTKTCNSVFVPYGSGNFSGTEYIDQVTLAPGLTIHKQSIGVASTSQGFNGTGIDGILGIGPVDLTLDTLSPDNSSTVPTVTDNLFSQGTISSDRIGISFEPTITGDEVNGEISWGGIDPTKYTGSITFIPITTTKPAGLYWGIDQSINYGSTCILSTTAGIVDTGTTLVLIATDGFNKYKAATGGVLDSATGLLTITSAQFSKLKNLSFTTGGTAFQLTPNAQIWPRSLNSAIGGASGQIYLIVADAGTNSGQGLDFINGFAFLERFYSVFDTTNQHVGLATTVFTNALTN